MTPKNRQPVGSIDLEAYADGLLAHDPARQAEVEEWLRARPREAALVAGHRAQNEAIRARYEHVLAEAVPDRLRRLIEAREPAPRRRWASAAQVAAVAVASGLAGWWLGHGGYTAAPPQERLSAIAMAAMAPSAQTAMSTVSGAEPLAWLSEMTILGVKPPDLSALGFELQERQLVVAHEQQAVRLAYGRADGAELAIYMVPRWTDRTSAVEAMARDGTRVAYWFAGPVGYAIAGRLSAAEMAEATMLIRNPANHAAARLPRSPMPEALRPAGSDRADAAVGTHPIVPTAGTVAPGNM